MSLGAEPEAQALASPHQLAAEARLRGARPAARLPEVAATQVEAAQHRRVQQRLRRADDQGCQSKSDCRILGVHKCRFVCISSIPKPGVPLVSLARSARQVHPRLRV